MLSRRGPIVAMLSTCLVATLLGCPSVGRAADTAPLSEQEAVRLALLNSPSLSASRREIEIAHARRIAAGAIAPTELLLSATVGDADATFNQIRQDFSLGGLPALRASQARAEELAAHASYLESALDVVSQVRTAYADLAGALVAEQNARLDVQSADRILWISQRRFEVGDAPRAYLVKAEVEQARSVVRLTSAQRATAVSRARLALLLNVSAASVTAVLPLEPVSPPQPPEVEAAVARRPLMRKVEAQVAAATAAVKVARVARVPVLSVLAYEDRLVNARQRGAGLQVTFPVFDFGTISGAVRQAEAERLQRLDQLEAARRQVRREVAEAWPVVVEASSKAATYRHDVLDRAAELLSMAQKGYQAGALTYLDVVEAQRTLREARQEYADILTQLARARAALDRATAADLAGILQLLEAGK